MRVLIRTLAVDFDSATDMGGFTFALMQKEGVDSLFRFNEPLGSDYVGTWKTNRQFIITILDWPGAGPPQVRALRASNIPPKIISLHALNPAMHTQSRQSIQ